MTQSDLAKEERAYALLQWNPYSLPNEFDWELAALGHYSKLQTERSNKALDEFDSINERDASDELAAFRELERLGVYSQDDFFSPTKATQGFYAKALREHRSSAGMAEGGQRTKGTRSDRHDNIRPSGMAPRYAERSRTFRPRPRHTGQGTSGVPG